MSADAISADGSLCRNCSTPAPGAFCPSCGQETDTRLPTLRKFMHDATGRLVSFDSRFWRTIFALVAKPGFLTREYLDGRRRRYIRPTRLYLVISVIFFGMLRLETSAPIPPDEKSIVIYKSDKAVREPASKSDRSEKDKSSASAGPASGAAGTPEEGFNLSFDENMNVVVEGTHNPFSDAVRERLNRFNRLTRTEKIGQIYEGMLRYGPYAMFVLLPAYAWLQQISYLGRARRYPGRPRKYVEHLVYAAHIHTFLFLAIMIAVVVPWAPLRLAIGAWFVYYLFQAKHVIYRGSRIGGLLRGAFVALFYAILFFLAIVALVFSAVLAT